MAHVVHSEPTVTAVEYPSSDGKPVAESDFQLTVLAYAREALRTHFRARDNVYVAANLLIYYQEGNVKARVAPDVFVVVGAANHERMSYRLWNEPKVPDWVLEITSRSTRHEDQGRKRDLYRRLGVTEYWQYDPTGDYLRPPLQALRLVAGEYEELACEAHGDGTLAMTSAALGLELRATGRGLRFHDPATGRDLPTYAERTAAQQQAEAGRQRAEARIAELEALLRTREANGRTE
jgi:Uma2 family endonuclease